MNAKRNGHVRVPPAVLRLIKERGPHHKLDIACGAHKQGPDWIGIDIQKLPGVDIVHDIETYPWPLPSDTFEIAVASHVAEHINPAKFGFINWMNELWRVMEPLGRLMIAVPYAGSPGYWQDPTHVNPCNEHTWSYFDPLHPSKFWGFYRPKPWRIVTCAWDQQGFMEVVMEKRRLDKSYAV